jgi:hypothetical protein
LNTVARDGNLATFRIRDIRDLNPLRRRPRLRLQEFTDERTYEAELGQCAGVTGFHHWFFLTAFAEALGLNMRAFAVDDGSERLGVVPMLLRRRGPVSTVNYLPVSCIGPVLRGEALRSGRASEMLRAVEPVLLRERAVVTRWAFSPGLDVGTDALAARGFDVSCTENFMVPGTKSIEDYLKGVAPKQRAALRRGEARGLSAGPSTSEEIARWLPWQLGGGSTGRPAVPGYSVAAGRIFAERLGADPRMLWRSIRAADGTTQAMTANIVDAERLWGWLLVGEPVSGPSPHVAAYWDSIKWSLGRQLSCDFGGAPTSGIRRFKSAMGGEVELCAVAERVRPRAYRQLRTLHARLANYRANRNELPLREIPPSAFQMICSLALDIDHPRARRETPRRGVPTLRTVSPTWRKVTCSDRVSGGLTIGEEIDGVRGDRALSRQGLSRPMLGRFSAARPQVDCLIRNVRFAHLVLLVPVRCL